MIYAGLHPVPVYKLYRFDWWFVGEATPYDSIRYSYRFPPYGSECYIVSAFDPIPLIQLVTGIVIVATVLLLVIRWRLHKRRTKSSETKDESDEGEDDSEGEERGFRGFGKVEQRDTEEFDEYQK